MAKNAANLGIEFSTSSTDDAKEGVAGIQETLKGIQSTLKSIKNINAFQTLLEGFELAKLGNIQESIENTFNSLKDGVQMSSSLDSEFASARKSAKELANSLGLNNEQMAEMRQKSSFAPALNMDLQEVQKTYARLLDRQMSVEDIGFDSFKQFAKFADVNNIEGQKFVDTMAKMRDVHGMTKEQMTGLTNNMATISKEFGVGSAVMGNFSDITETVAGKLQDVHGEVQPGQVQKYSQQVAKMTGMLKTSGQGMEEARKGAMEFTERLLGAREEMQALVTGKGGDVPDLVQKVATSMGGVETAQEALGEKPVQFMKSLREEYKKGGQAAKNFKNQRVFKTLNSSVQDFIKSGNVQKANEALNKTEKAMKDNAGAAKNMAEMYDTGRTMAEELAFQEDLFEKRLLDTSKSMGIQDDMLTVVKESYDTVASNLETFVNLQGAAKDETTGATESISRMGVKLTDTEGKVTAMGSVVQEASRLFVAFKTGGLFGVAHQLGRITSSIFGFNDAGSMLRSIVKSLVDTFRPLGSTVANVYKAFQNKGPIAALDLAFRRLQGGVEQLRGEAMKLVDRVPELIGQFDSFLDRVHKTNPALATAIKFATAFAGVFVGGQIVGALGTLLGPLGSFVGILGKIPGLGGVTSILGNIGGAFATLSGNMISSGLFKLFGPQGLASKMVSGIAFMGKALSSAIMEGLMPALSRMFPFISTIGSSIVGAFTSMIGTIMGPLASAMAPLGSFIAGLFTPPAGWIMLALAGIGGMTAWINAEFEKGWSGFIDWAKGYISGTLTTMENFLFDEFFGIVGSIGEMFGMVSERTAKQMKSGGAGLNKALFMYWLGLNDLGSMDMGGIADSLVSSISTLFQSLFSAVFSGMVQVSNLAVMAYDWLRNTLTGINFAKLGKTISTSWLDFLGNTLSFIFGNIYSAFKGGGGEGSLASSLSTLFTNAGQILMDVGVILWEVTSGVVELFWGLFSGSFNQMMSLNWSSILSNIWTKLGEVLLITLDGLNYLVGEITEWFTEMFYAGLEYFMNSPWSGWFSDIWDALKTAFWTTLETYIDVYSWIYGYLWDGFKSAFQALTGVNLNKYLKPIWKNFKSAIKSGWKTVKDFVSSVASDTFAVLSEVMSGNFDVIIDPIKESLDWIYTNFMETFIHLRAGVQKIFIPIKQTFLGLVDFIKFKVIAPIISQIDNLISGLESIGLGSVLDKVGLETGKQGLVGSVIGDEEAKRFRQGVSVEDIGKRRAKKMQKGFQEVNKQKDKALDQLRDEGRGLEMNAEPVESGEEPEQDVVTETKEEKDEEIAQEQLNQMTTLNGHIKDVKDNIKKDRVEKRTKDDDEQATSDYSGIDKSPG